MMSRDSQALRHDIHFLYAMPPSGHFHGDVGR